MIVDLILLKNRNFCVQSQNCLDSLERGITLNFLQNNDLRIASILLIFQNFGIKEVLEQFRSSQTVLFLTDSAFFVLFAYFYESMGSIGGYDPWKS